MHGDPRVSRKSQLILGLIFGAGLAIFLARQQPAPNPERLQPDALSPLVIEKEAPRNAVDAIPESVRLAHPHEVSLAARGIWFQPVNVERFPTIESGRLRSKIQLQNIHPFEPLFLQRAEVVATSCESPDTTHTQTFLPEQLLGISRLDALEEFEGEFNLLLSEGRWCRWIVEVHGEFSEGTPSSFKIGLEHGVPDWVEQETDREAVKRAFEERIKTGSRHVEGPIGTNR